LGQIYIQFHHTSQQHNITAAAYTQSDPQCTILYVWEEATA